MAERDRVVAWKKRGRGKGLRWHMQREIVGLLSRKASNNTDVQSVMTMMRGMSHKKTIELLRELQEAKCVVQEHDNRMGYYWIATSLGVKVYLGNMTAIPLRVAEELLASLERQSSMDEHLEGEKTGTNNKTG